MKISFLKNTESGFNLDFNVFELLSDPVRTRIFLELYLKQSTTIEELSRITEKSRSTISHHLSKLIEKKIINVEIGSGKVKKYILHQDMINKLRFKLDKEKFTDSSQEEKKEFLLELLRTLSVFFNSVTSLFIDGVKNLNENQTKIKNINYDTNSKEIKFQFKDKEYSEPEMLMVPLKQDMVTYFKERFNEVWKETTEKFNFNPQEMFRERDKIHSFLTMSLFPYIEWENKGIKKN